MQTSASNLKLVQKHEPNIEPELLKNLLNGKRKAPPAASPLDGAAAAAGRTCPGGTTAALGARTTSHMPSVAWHPAFAASAVSLSGGIRTAAATIGSMCVLCAAA